MREPPKHQQCANPHSQAQELLHPKVHPKPGPCARRSQARWAPQALHPHKTNPYQLEEQEMCFHVLRMALNVSESSEAFLKVINISSSCSSANSTPNMGHASLAEEDKENTPLLRLSYPTHRVKCSFQPNFGAQQRWEQAALPFLEGSLQSSCKQLHTL